MIAIGAWELMENKRVAPYTGMRVWESEGPASMNFDARELGVNELGYMIENDVIQTALQERLTQFPNVEFMYPIQIESIEMPPDHMATNPVVVKTKQGHTYTAKMIVGADGANSFVRNSANINTLGYSYNQMVRKRNLNLTKAEANDEFLLSHQAIGLPDCTRY
jgi:2-polyprenyl-6-methoxyphenol hydroxylase-like FAD-dependent oxidoreductase